MQKILACALFVTVFTHTITFNSSNNILPKNNWQQTWLKYTDSAQKITVQYPDNWSFKSNTGNALFVIKSPEENQPDSFLENINLIVREIPAENGQLDFESFKGEIIEQLSSVIDSFKLLYSKDIKWKTEDGYEMSFTGFEKNSGLPLIITQRYLYNHGRLLVCTYTAQGLKKDIYRLTGVSIMNKISW